MRNDIAGCDNPLLTRHNDRNNNNNNNTYRNEHKFNYKSLRHIFQIRIKKRTHTHTQKNNNSETKLYHILHKKKIDEFLRFLAADMYVLQ